jgi:ppGpp synthetase/RelA/SpoT-type nucleotidyltranferase
VKRINSEGVMKEITASISSKLSDVGIMFRLFSRAKTQKSLQTKLESDPSYGKGKKLQDLIGVRVVLYFNDDIETVRDIISSSFDERSKDVSIDESKNDEFRATRYNIVYSLDQKYTDDLNLKDESLRIDNTFELQIRTIFSEGWHEVEHDLRYKCKSDWQGFDNQSRRLNGVYATLETSEWTMIKIFDEIAYSHYKNREWSAMFRQKFRLRFIDETLDENLLAIFEDKDLVKRFFRLERSRLIRDMSMKGFYYPMKLQNLIYFANIHKIKDESIMALTPKMMIEEMSI